MEQQYTEQDLQSGEIISIRNYGMSNLSIIDIETEDKKRVELVIERGFSKRCGKVGHPKYIEFIQNGWGGDEGFTFHYECPVCKQISGDNDFDLTSCDGCGEPCFNCCYEKNLCKECYDNEIKDKVVEKLCPDDEDE